MLRNKSGILVRPWISTRHDERGKVVVLHYYIASLCVAYRGAALSSLFTATLLGIFAGSTLCRLTAMHIVVLAVSNIQGAYLAIIEIATALCSPGNDKMSLDTAVACQAIYTVLSLVISTAESTGIAQKLQLY